MLKNKGNALMEWTVVFAVLLAVSAMVQVPLKKAVQIKIAATADWVFWKIWRELDPQSKLESPEKIMELGSPEKNVRVQAAATQQQKATVSEDNTGKITSCLTGLDPSKPSTRTENRVSSSVEEGSEALLN